MGRKTDMTDHMIFMKLVNIFYVIRGHAGIPVFDSIYIMDHAQIDVIGFHPLKNVFERGNDMLHIPGPDILPVLIC